MLTVVNISGSGVSRLVPDHQSLLTTFILNTRVQFFSAALRPRRERMSRKIREGEFQLYDDEEQEGDSRYQTRRHPRPGYRGEDLR